MKTAVEWLFEKLWETPKDKLTWHSILEQAKQMEKEQSIAELRHKDGTPMRKYNSPKLQEIEMENKHTAVQWLVEKIQQANPSFKFDALIRQAKEMEKEQIENAHRHGFTEGTCFGSSPIGYKFTTSEQYYNETFKSE